MKTPTPSDTADSIARRLFLVNPSAGGGISESRLQLLRALAAAHSGEMILSSSKQDLIGNAAQAVKDGWDQIVAVGGDGTVNSVANGFFSEGDASPLRRSCLAVIPFGTGSDYFRTLKGLSENTWEQILLRPRVILADAAWFRRRGETGSCFLNMASLGNSAAVVARKERLPGWMPRSLRYAVPTLMQIPSLQPFSAVVKLDGRAISGRFLNIFLAKGAWAGGGMRLGGDASLRDGYFDVTLLDAMSPTEAFRNLPHLFRGTLHEMKGIQRHRAAHVEVISESPIPIEVDGELAGSGTAEFRILPGRIKVCTA